MHTIQRLSFPKFKLVYSGRRCHRTTISGPNDHLWLTKARECTKDTQRIGRNVESARLNPGVLIGKWAAAEILTMSLLDRPPAPPTKLGVYRILSPNAGVHVSPLQLGAGSIGDQWHKLGMGAMDKTDSFKLLDAYFDAGGNFIDTANGYQDETSEMFIGEWMEQRGIRDQIVLSTKFTMNFKARQNVQHQVNYAGNNRKSMTLSVEASLKKLRTSYIDILYVHFWDWDTSIRELMDGLHNLVALGKVLYLGISDTPAWVVAQANQYALDHGKSPFAIYQGCWNVLDRSLEREVIPMVRAHGMALAPWNVLAQGKFRTDAEEEARRVSGEKGRMLFSADWERNEDEKKISHALEKVAGEIGAKSITSVAIAYLMHKVPYCFPIIGGRKVEHLMSNIEALEVSLSPEQIKFLEGVLKFDPGFPATMIGNGITPTPFLETAGHYDRVPVQQTIPHTKQ
ncbi:unnamed protein product [Mycena citricolor]|uniref:NADP-dependent oxidoreductase domain-containing protein n=1 Tax=Mycena citricolor TaxID=2018698 RepID=A0AAD2JWI8_9AGAR|nr:unnamed protein product [Mycena citricolor]